MQTNEALLNQLNAVWGECAERFQAICPNFGQYFKRAKQDTSQWVMARLKVENKVLQNNASLFKLFESQLVLVFQIHLVQTDLLAKLKEEIQHKETSQF